MLFVLIPLSVALHIPLFCLNIPVYPLIHS
jgi:hypothetical protein